VARKIATAKLAIMSNCQNSPKYWALQLKDWSIQRENRAESIKNNARNPHTNKAENAVTRLGAVLLDE
jgi:hypothetical protein